MESLSDFAVTYVVQETSAEEGLCITKTFIDQVSCARRIREQVCVV